MIGAAKEALQQEETKRNEIISVLEKEAQEYKSKLKSGIIQQDEKSRNNPISKLSAKRREKKAVLFEFYDVKALNAETVVNRPDDMSFVHNFLKKNYPEDALKFRFINRAPKPVQSWSCDWNKDDDEKLLVGVDKYGYGSWVQIRDDPFLGLTEKIFLNEAQPTANDVKSNNNSNNDNNSNNVSELPEKKGKGITGSSKKVPGAVHLSRRVDYLFAVLKEEVKPSTPSSNSSNSSISTSAIPKKRQRKVQNSRSGTPDIKSEGHHPLVKRIKNTHSHSNSPKPQESDRKGTPAVALSNKKSKVKVPERKLPENEYESMDEDECNHTMQPIRPSLKRLSRGGKGLDRKEWAQILKKDLKTVGDHIESRKGTSRKHSPDKFKKHLWAFSTYYWPVAVKSSKLMAMYDKIVATMSN